MHGFVSDCTNRLSPVDGVRHIKQLFLWPFETERLQNWGVLILYLVFVQIPCANSMVVVATF